MARTARVVAAGVPMHVIQRGNNRSEVFRSAEDRIAYRDSMFRSAEISGCAIHAYVLMSNHVHILLTPVRTESVARMMRRLGSIYVRRFNDLYGRTGTLWEDRFRSIVIESDRYFFACSRYIELNPVRASLANHPAGHPWSSYASNAKGQTDARLQPHPLYLALANSARGRCREYTELFAQVLAEETLEALRGRGIAGSREFCEKLAPPRPRLRRPGAHGGDRKGRRFVESRNPGFAARHDQVSPVPNLIPDQVSPVPSLIGGRRVASAAL